MDLSGEETVVPTFNKDPPITMEEALELVQGDPDKYSIRSLYFIANLLSMTGFMLFLSTIFLFQEPKVDCYNEELKLYFRCSVTQACSNNYIDKHRL
jgi:hypothetical protein